MSHTIIIAMKSPCIQVMGKVLAQQQKWVSSCQEMRVKANRACSKIPSAKHFSGEASMCFWPRFRKVLENSTTCTSGTIMQASLIRLFLLYFIFWGRFHTLWVLLFCTENHFLPQIELSLHRSEFMPITAHFRWHKLIWGWKEGHLYLDTVQ